MKSGRAVRAQLSLELQIVVAIVVPVGAEVKNSTATMPTPSRQMATHAPLASRTSMIDEQQEREQECRHGGPPTFAAGDRLAGLRRSVGLLRRGDFRRVAISVDRRVAAPRP